MTGFSYSGTELDALADARNYYEHIRRRFASHLGAKVVEVGAGIGTFSQYLLRSPGVQELIAIEPAVNNFPVLRDRFASDRRVTTRQGELRDFADKLVADSLVAVNVMEHIEDDVSFLRDARRVLGDSGTLLLFVPALQSIYGTLDEAFDHYRRYDRSLLHSRLSDAGFGMVRTRYVNMPGIAAWYLAGRVMRRRTLDPRSVRFYDRFVVPVVAAVEAVIEPPAGQSLLAIARTR
ncbi:MAG TPA: class I SAM-dependent methyltransferase [Gemmatimonadaceae bacterium]|nr:class I SAM-dependent methyltransferase [Gemmatimonadaceae bacterium]